MSKSPNELIAHILKEVDYLAKSTVDFSEAQFMQDETKQRAFERSIEIIGEAVKHLPKQFTQEHNEIDWSSIAKMHDRLIHHYFGTDYAIVWEVVTNEIPKLKHKIQQLK